MTTEDPSQPSLGVQPTSPAPNPVPAVPSAVAPSPVSAVQPVPSAPEPEPAPPSDLSATVAKWLVPSFGVLFALIGYTVGRANRSLLGFPTDEGGLASGNTADAADFLSYVFTLVGDRVLALASWQSVSLGGHGVVLGLCGVAAALAAAWRLSMPGRRARRSSAWALGVVVVVLVTTKFTVFDAPAMRIESVIVGVGVPQAAAEPQPGQPVTRSIAMRLHEVSDGQLDRAISRRARALWHLIVCSRAGQVPLPADADLAGDGPCSSADGADKATLAGEFDAGLLLGLLIAVPAGLLLAVRTPLGNAVSLLALAYLLTIPYAYGKLLKPVEFTYALMRFMPGTLLTAATGESATPADRIYGFVLARDGGAVTLLQAVPEKCSEGTSTALRFSSVPVSKLVSIEQIYRKDVIEWAVRTQHKCPNAPPPFRPGKL